MMKYDAVELDVLMMSVAGTQKYDFIRYLDPSTYSNWVYFVTMKFLCIHCNLKSDSIVESIDGLIEKAESLQKALTNYMEVFYHVDKVDLKQSLFIYSIANFLPSFLELLKTGYDVTTINVKGNNLTLQQTLKFLEDSRVDE